MSTLLEWIAQNRETIAWIAGGVAAAAGGLGWYLRRDGDSSSSRSRPPPDSAVSAGQLAKKADLDDQKTLERVLIAEGLAVGYYYNFLKVFSQELRRNRFTFLDEKQNEREIDSAHVDIRVLLPNRLDEFAYESCENYLRERKTKRGTLSTSSQFRGFGFNYAEGTDGYITIVDYARPVKALSWYYKEIKHVDTVRANEQWRKIELEEINAFWDTVERLRERDPDSGLTNRLSHVKLG